MPKTLLLEHSSNFIEKGWLDRLFPGFYKVQHIEKVNRGKMIGNKGLESKFLFINKQTDISAMNDFNNKKRGTEMV